MRSSVYLARCQSSVLQKGIVFDWVCLRARFLGRSRLSIDDVGDRMNASQKVKSQGQRAKMDSDWPLIRGKLLSGPKLNDQLSRLPHFKRRVSPHTSPFAGPAPFFCRVFTFM